MTSLRRTQRPNPCHLPFHIPRGRGNYPFPLAGVNGPSHSYSCIWRKCPKEVFVSKRRLEIAVTDAIEKHNLGYVKSFEAKEDSCLYDSFSLTIAERQDKRRISQNISTKQKKRKRNATNTNAAYSAGAF
ncbi:uncharacterized protein TNCV_4250421 [Trichonephila clavipes]|nr:uncharacterized protein TNCV_4250421 [Trichonephila clavipes]